jgi:hypothetical protein
MSVISGISSRRVRRYHRCCRALLSADQRVQTRTYDKHHAGLDVEVAFYTNPFALDGILFNSGRWLAHSANHHGGREDAWFNGDLGYWRGREWNPCKPGQLLTACVMRQERIPNIQR